VSLWVPVGPYRRLGAGRELPVHTSVMPETLARNDTRGSVFVRAMRTPTMMVAVDAPTLPIPRVQSLRLLRRDPITLLERVAAVGDVVRVPMPRFTVFVLNHPDLVWDVLATDARDFMKGPTMQAAKMLLGESLLTSEGEYHRTQRRLIQPIFHHDRIEAYAAAMVELSERAAARWQSGDTIDVHAEMARLTLSIVGRTLFAADVESGDAHRIGTALAETLAQFGRVFSPFLSITSRLPLPATRRFERAKAVFDSTFFAMIADRRAHGADGGDVLSLLLRAQEDGAGMTDQQVRDEAITLFLAGHETTSNALTWTWFLLSEHPVEAEQMHRELDGLGDDPPTVDRLPFTAAVIRESMRLYPPAWAIGRRVLASHAANGVEIRKGSVVIVSPWLLHHDERWWPGAREFRPERWLEYASNRPRHTFIPFGGGPRMCIGEGFAQLEALLVLATIARDWRFEHDPNHRVELQPVVTLRPRTGMPMRAIRRSPRAT
jgi:cytochrome P450